MRPTRSLAAVAAAATLLLPAAPAAAADDDQLADPAYAAASWLAAELAADGGLLDDGFSGPSVGLTLDAILALSIVDVAGGQADASLSVVAGQVGDYVAPGGDVVGGAAAKTLLGVAARGGDVTAFGGRDLEADLRGAIDTDPSDDGDADATTQVGQIEGASVFAHALAVSALAEASGNPADPDLVLVADHLAEQCHASGCGSPDDTAAALLAFRDAERTVDAEEAQQALLDAQAADGSYDGGFGANSNSTGLPAWALRIAGSTAAADAAAGYLATLQLGTAFPDADRGALAFAQSGFGSYEGAEAAGGIPDGERGSFKLATAQGVLGLVDSNPEPFTGATPDDDTAGAPAAASPVGACTDQTGVTLVVDPASLADAAPQVVCVTPFDGMDGLDLLLAGGFDVTTQDSSFGPSVCQIDGLPGDVSPSCFGSESDPSGFWASYVADGDSGEWTTASTGVAGDSPTGGDSRGWVWEDDATDDEQVEPAVAPATFGADDDQAPADDPAPADDDTTPSSDDDVDGVVAVGEEESDELPSAGTPAGALAVLVTALVGGGALLLRRTAAR